MEMKEIFALYAETRSIALRNILVELNIGLARTTAHRMGSSCKESYQDLFELATLGLIKAVERFNPAEKYFTSFALPYCKGEILHFLRDKGTLVRIPRGLHDLSGKVKKARNTLSLRLNRRPSDVEVAEYLKISLAQVQEAQAVDKSRRYIWSLDTAIDSTDDLTLGDTLVSEEPPKLPHTEKILQKLRDAIALLNNPAIDLIYLQNKSIKEAQKILKMSQTQINALLQQGINQLAEMEICDLDEAVQIVSQCEDIKNFEKFVGYLLPSDAIAFLQEWLFGQLAAA